MNIISIGQLKCRKPKKSKKIERKNNGTKKINKERKEEGRKKNQKQGP